jgi:hypothetical protein
MKRSKGIYYAIIILLKILIAKYMMKVCEFDCWKGRSKIPMTTNRLEFICLQLKIQVANFEHLRDCFEVQVEVT